MSNTSVDNTANGAFALQSNTMGSANTAVGSQALSFNTEGSGNTATGGSALFSNTTGDFNTASGDEAKWRNWNRQSSSNGRISKRPLLNWRRPSLRS
jgi:trimeric autotransporter adhesin